MISSLKKAAAYIFHHKLILLITIIGFILTLVTILFDGQYGCVKNQCGFIIGTNYRDGIWFQAVAATAFKTFPFRMPIFSGAPLQGYNYLPNLITHLLTYVGLPIPFTYYKLFPILYVIFLTLLAVIFARKIKENPQFVMMFLFFVFFGIPLTLITSLHYYGYIKNYVLINTFQATRILESMHYGFSFIILLIVLIFLTKKSLKLKHQILISTLIFLSFGIKFYVAAILLFMVWLHETLLFIRHRNIKSYIIVNILYGFSAILSILMFYDPLGASKGGSIFILAPFSTVHHLIENESLFYLPNMVLARYFLYAHGMSSRLIAIELFSTFLFVVFYFGTRAVGFLYIAKQLITRRITQFEVVITAGIVLGIILAVMLIQKGDWFNPMQFAVCAAFLMNIFAAKFMYELFRKNKILGIVVGFIIFVLTFIPNLINLRYLSDPARYVVPQREVQALNFLKKQPDGAIFAPIVDPDLSYVSAFTGKQTYVNFTNVLENTGIAFQNRLDSVQDPKKIDVDSLDVRYAYISTTYKKWDILVNKFKSSLKYKEIYKNDQVVIFEKII